MKFSVEKVYSKGIKQINEDEILIKDNIFAVFDGASSLVKFLSKEGKTGGKIAAEISKNVFSENNDSLKNLAIKANDLIREKMKSNKVNINKKEALWSTSAAVIRIKKDCAEFFQIGDSLILVIKNDKPRIVTKYYDQDMETMIKWKKLADKKEKNIREKLTKQIIKVRRRSNICYGDLNGEKKAIKFFNIGKFKLKNIESIILFTDGLLIPKKDPKENEDWNKFVKLYKKLGLKGLLRFVRSLEDTDPNCFLYPRFKMHDDIATIAIKIK
jgi:serine/threonine protein phosphatase PrpC